MEAAGVVAACDPERPELLAETLERLLGDPAGAAEMATRAFDFCQRQYCLALTVRPFLAFIERATAAASSASAKSAAEPTAATAAEWIAGTIDPERRRADWAELAHYRAGRWHRLRRWLADLLG
jgi:hypothetical protein